MKHILPVYPVKLDKVDVKTGKVMLAYFNTMKYF